MSLGGCIPGLVEDGKLSQEQAAEVRAIYDEYLEEFTRTGSPEAAEALASQAALVAMTRQVKRKRFLAGQAIRARQRIMRDMQTYDSESGLGGVLRKRFTKGGGAIDERAGAALIDYDPRAPYANVEAQRKVIKGEAQRLMDQILGDHSANLLGQVRNKARLNNIRDEIFGKDTGDAAAKELAGAWRQTAEMLRRKFNKAGGDIGHRADWGLPQSHDLKKVNDAGFPEWKKYLLGDDNGVGRRLDLSKMIDRRTGQPFTARSIDQALRETFDNIKTNGRASRKPGEQGGKSLANQRGDPRFLVFKDGKAWGEYSDKFGAGSVYDVMMGHIEGMSRDIAAMEVLGPNPESTLAWVKDVIANSADRDRSPGSNAADRARTAGKQIDDLWNEYAGNNLEPRNQKFARVGSGWRAWETARKLGGAFVSATSDFAFQDSRRALNGLRSRTILPQYIKLMQPGKRGKAAQQMAVRRGLIAQEWADRTASQSRDMMEELSGEIPRRLSDGVLRLSLLTRHTQSMRWAYGMETLASYTEAAGKTYGELNKGMRNALKRYGISASDWDKIRTAPMDKDGGVDWIAPHNIEDSDVGDAFMRMIYSETSGALPEANLKTRAFMNSKLERGTVLGETGRSMLQFKSFGISVMLRQVQDIMAMPGAITPAKYAARLFIGTTLMGAVALQLKAISQGKDPRPMDNLEFWGAAIAQGGGFGIFGDLLNSSVTRTGGGLGEAILGPTIQDAEDLWKLASSKHPERDAVRVGKGFIPGNSLWYIRAAFDRMAADTVQEAIDPAYPQSYRRAERYANEQGTDYFWEPGDALPERAPDFENALGEGSHK